MNSKITITCRDCGAKIENFGRQPKDVAKKAKWVHAGKDKWRCASCQDFQQRILSTVPSHIYTKY